MQFDLKVEVININAEKIRPLRHAELRQGKDFSSTSYIRDNDHETFHLASIINDQIIVCATFYPELTDKKHSKNAYRLRGMATHSNFRRKGYGAELMNKSFKILKQKKCDLLWCNARLVAVNFYKSLGFNIIGDLFDIKEIGPHYYMYKEI